MNSNLSSILHFKACIYLLVVVSTVTGGNEFSQRCKIDFSSSFHEFLSSPNYLLSMNLVWERFNNLNKNYADKRSFGQVLFLDFCEQSDLEGKVAHRSFVPLLPFHTFTQEIKKNNFTESMIQF